MKAVESMPLIERAFASSRVDELVAGDVENVQIEFGLKKQREHPRKPNKLTKIGYQLRATFAAAGLTLPDASDLFREPEDEFMNVEDYSRGQNYEPPATHRPAKNGSLRSVPVRQRQEAQEVLRGVITNMPGAEAGAPGSTAVKNILTHRRFCYQCPEWN